MIHIILRLLSILMVIFSLTGIIASVTYLLVSVASFSDDIKGICLFGFIGALSSAILYIFIAEGFITP